MYYLKQILYKISIERITIEYNLAENIYEICKQHGNNFFLVADENTAKLLNKNILTHLIIPGNSIASTEIVDLVRNKAKDSDLIVAFGSGTISDICKYASYLEKKNYILFPTAASMNGYTSLNASILANGYKKSFAAHLPRAIYIDIDILINAPHRLTLSGFADFICRSTVQADWLLSHLLLETEYNELPFTLVHDLEQILLKEYMGLAEKSTDVILLLIEALLISGIGMTIVKGSHSASQGEHIIAHAMEMVTKDYSSLHGEKVAVATITMASLQEKILSIENPIIKPANINAEHIIDCFGDNRPLSKPIYDQKFLGEVQASTAEYSNVFEERSSESTTKLPLEIEFRKRSNEYVEILKHKQIVQQKISEFICKEWGNIVSKIKQNLLPAKCLQKIFEDLSIPHLPEHLSWDKKQYCKVVNYAFATRDRFTFLDLASLIIRN